jgi:hypothetical protein
VPIRHRRSVSFDLNPQYGVSSSMSSRGRAVTYSQGSAAVPAPYPKPVKRRSAPPPEKKSPYPAEFSPRNRAPEGIKNIVIIGGECLTPFTPPSCSLRPLQGVSLSSSISLADC